MKRFEQHSFNLYSEKIFREALEDGPKGIIERIVKNNFRYADDPILVARSKDDLQALKTTMTDDSQFMCLRTNVNNTQMDGHQQNKVDNMTEDKD